MSDFVDNVIDVTEKLSQKGELVPRGKGSPVAKKRSGECCKKVIADREYTLMERKCPECDIIHYEIFRFAGTSFSRYLMDETFQIEYFEDFVENIDVMLLETAADLIQDYYRSLVAKNSERGIEADGTFAFRLLEYGRHRSSRLQKLGYLDVLISRDAPKSPAEEAVRNAFELGMATAEHRLIDTYEQYLWDGMAMSEWRETGLPMARAERLRRGKITHTAVVAAARKLFKTNPNLKRNDSETARQIIGLKLPELQKGAGVCVSLDTITKHLRRAREDKEL